MHPRIPSLLAAALATGLLAFAGAASATTAIHLTDARQAALSDAVVLAEVGAQQAIRHERSGRIHTLTDVRVQEVLAGSAPATLRIEQVGGTLDGVGTHVAGDAVFEPGERCVLFLRQVDGGWYLTALQQSRYGVGASPLGEVLVRPPMHGLLTRAGDGSLVPYEEPLKPVRTLDEFRAEAAEWAVGSARVELTGPAATIEPHGETAEGADR